MIEDNNVVAPRVFCHDVIHTEQKVRDQANSQLAFQVKSSGTDKRLIKGINNFLEVQHIGMYLMKKA